MKRVAIVVSGVVQNVIVAEDDFQGGIDIGEAACGPGYTWDGNVFTAPEPTAEEIAEASERVQHESDRGDLIQAFTTWETMTAAQRWVAIKGLLRYVRRLEKRLEHLGG